MGPLPAGFSKRTGRKTEVTCRQTVLYYRRAPGHTLYQMVRWGDDALRDYIEERIFQSAAYIIENGATVRDAARVFKISKSTVHKDVSERLLTLNPGMASQVRAVLDRNKAERHIRGGQATYRKYKCQDTQPG
jgi:putative DeoR family transcriptional regulator (stage III sporulation protein D)